MRVTERKSTGLMRYEDDGRRLVFGGEDGGRSVALDLQFPITLAPVGKYLNAHRALELKVACCPPIVLMVNDMPSGEMTLPPNP